MDNIFRGFGIALVTPFAEDGSIAYGQLADLIEYQIENRADFLCALGSTAETPCLSDKERQDVKNFVIRQVKGRIPVLLGFGDNSTDRLVRNLKSFDFSGVDGILSVCPYYNKPSQEGIYRHFEVVAKNTDLPIVVYNIPGRCGANIMPATLRRMTVNIPNIVAVKEASGNVNQIDTILETLPSDFGVISGEDAITYEMLLMGAVGVISVIGNALPKLFGSMVHYLQQNNEAEALKIHRKLFDFYRLLSVDGNPSGIKCLLSVMNMTGNRLRLPLVPVTPETEQKIRAAYAALFK